MMIAEATPSNSSPGPMPFEATQGLQDLVRAAQRGHRFAFESLWSQQAPRLKAILESMVCAQDAEDLLQEVALRAWRAIGTLEDPGRFTAWISTIARNLGRNALAARRGPRDTSIHDESVLAALSDPREPRSGPDAKDLIEDIRGLPRAYHRPLILKIFFELSGTEISQRTGLTPGSVRVNLCRGMKQLRERLQAEYSFA
ncbi:MAG: sigma-70 family RNA polymerase sigma factor [Planctomycetes bacterium]|nr:sigma-70 family RNA polymerase sigma factor [Planctomycetota bacterium]